MTSIVIPDFIFKMFTQKVLEMNNNVIDKLCEHYKIDKDDAKRFLEKELNIDFNIVNEDIEQIKIVKKHKKKEQKDDQKLETNTTSYCDARVFIQSELIVKQCSRSKLNGQSFCKTHQKQYETGTLKYGTIHQAKPDSISTEKLNMKVKRTIY